MLKKQNTKTSKQSRMSFKEGSKFLNDNYKDDKKGSKNASSELRNEYNFMDGILGCVKF